MARASRMATPLPTTSPRTTGTESTPLTGEVGLSRNELIKLVGICSYSWFMWNLMYTTIVPMLPFYARLYNLTSLHQGMILASLQIGFLLGVTVLNLFGLRPLPMVYVGGVCYFIGPCIIAYDPGLYTMMTGRFIEGVGASFLVITFDSTMARLLAPEQKGRAFGIKGAIGTSGLFFGPIVGGILFQYGGLKLPMTVIACFGACGLVLYFCVMPTHWFRERNEILASGCTVRERYEHFWDSNILFVLMVVQMMTFTLIGILFLAVPEFLSSYFHVGTVMMTVMWVGWDIMKCIGSVIGGYCADKFSPWAVTFGGLILQSFFMMACSDASNSALEAKAAWNYYWFLISVGIVFSLGTTIDGFIGGPFVKLLTEVERMLGQVRYEELFSISCSVVACGEAMGNLYCGMVYSQLGFGFTLYSFAWFQLVGILVCGYAVQSMVRPLFDAGKDDDAINKKFGNI